MITLKGLSVESFAHPDEIKMLNAMDRMKLNRMIEWLSSSGGRIALKSYLVRYYIRLSQRDLPAVFGLLKETCEVLDFHCVPQVFTYRSPKIDYGVFLGDEPVLICPDFVFAMFDEQMLRFYFGSAITAMKAKTFQLKAAATFAAPVLKQIPIFGDAALPLLANWARKNCFTDDRGGLLACQDINSAMRTLLLPTGIMPSQFNPEHVLRYIAAYKPVSKLSQIGQYVQTINRMTPWNNDRSAELFRWYSSGAYDNILEDY